MSRVILNWFLDVGHIMRHIVKMHVIRIQQYYSVQLHMQEKVVRHAAEKGLLLMRVKDLPTSGGILSERQKQWMNTAPYDSKTENPVLYRLVSTGCYCYQTSVSYRRRGGHWDPPPKKFENYVRIASTATIEYITL